VAPAAKVGVEQMTLIKFFFKIILNEFTLAGFLNRMVERHPMPHSLAERSQIWLASRTSDVFGKFGQ